jgi:hypothetical protein
MGGKTKDGHQKNPRSRWVKGGAPRYTKEQEDRFALAAAVKGWHAGAKVRQR